MTRVLVNGALGRMGSESVNALNSDPEIELVATIDRNDDLIQSIKETTAQVVLDFTTAESGFANAQKILSAGAAPVIGTSGFNAEQVKILQDLAQKLNLPGIIVPNFAIGAVLMMQFATKAAQYLPHVEIIETHHNKKADAPSGTAIKTAEIIAQVRNKPEKLVEETELIPGARGANFQEIPIHSLRLPGFIAQQTVIFGAEGERLIIQHDSIDRKCFMPGVCLACKKVLSLNTLVYGLEHIL